VRVPLLAAAVAVSACARDVGSRGSPAALEPPRRRYTGERAPEVAGGDLRARGWVRLEDGLWIEVEHADAFRRGLLWTGTRYAPPSETDPTVGAARESYVLRTDHVVLRTNVPFARARALAVEVEAHVDRVVAAFGEALDLRLPADPLPVVVASRRSEFERLLAHRVASPVSWGAFYSPDDGTVYACEQRRAEGGLPVVVDLRHETTHAVLDLGRPSGARSAMFARPHFWLWEGVAVHSEGFGDPPEARATSERASRLKRRLAWGERPSVDDLVRRTQAHFEGRHYDQAGSLATWLLEAEGGRRRAGTLALLARAMDGLAEESDLQRLVGLSSAEAQSGWMAALGYP
jgi:hypothetical protein